MLAVRAGAEDEVRAAMRASARDPGQYIVPHVADHKLLKNPEVMQKFVDGPVAVIAMRRPGAPAMGGFLAQWFVLNLVVALIAAYIASKMVPVHPSFLAVARPVSRSTD